YQDRTSFARSSGLPVVSLDVIKRKGENLLSASDKIKEIVEQAKKEKLPKSMKVSIFNDQSIQTRDQVVNLENSIIFGMLLVILVLLFFLGIRNATFVGVAIPFSMLLGFIVVGILGYTLNMMILFGMIMALGMLVDNGIVVIENIYRHRQEGFSPIEAAKRGTGEVAVPIIASTATTLAAFLPLAFWPGLMGSFMKYLPITLIIVLTSSLFVGLVINPVLASYFMKLEDHSVETKQRNRKIALWASGAMLVFALLAHFFGVLTLRNLLIFSILVVLVNTFVFNYFAEAFQGKFLPWLEDVYGRSVRFALHWPKLTLLGTVILFILSLVLLGLRKPKVDFFPQTEPLYVNAFVDMPLGSDIEATNEVMKTLEKKVMKALKPYEPIVEEVLTQIGENTADPNGPPEPGASPNKARLTVSFVPDKDRGEMSTKAALIDIRNAVQGLPGVKVAVEGNKNGPPAGKPINLELKSDDIDTLLNLSAKIISYINQQNIGGIEELKADVELNKPQLIIHIDREAARRYEISTGQIASEIRTAVFGDEASKFKQGEDEYPIEIRLAEKYRNNIDDLLAQKITFRNPANGRIAQVPISAVANIEYGSTYSSIKRKNLQRVVTVYSNVEENYNANEIVAQLKGLMESYPLPKGVTYEFSGEQEEQAKAMAFLNRAFMIALMAIFFILVAQFNSVVTPFIIVLSIVFSTIGVFLGYAASGDSFVVIMTGMGIISLAGIVVNNAIVLIDYIEISLAQRRKDLGLGEKERLVVSDFKDLIAKAGAVRLRPVLLTAITTVLGLLPMALGININFSSLLTDLDPQYYRGGESADFWAPMSWTIIYGLTFATFLTLIVVPVMYYSFNRVTNFFKDLVHRI
ncbi:MAG TPA: efflux RND transporter permease subunit, partial [Saprospiraceae bacterium]|nr:efflux RND transporter permease subunit [Saprospiraceae bacterium]